MNNNRAGQQEKAWRQLVGLGGNLPELNKYSDDVVGEMTGDDDDENASEVEIDIENKICFERGFIQHQNTRQIDEISIATELSEDIPEKAIFFGSDVSAGDHCVESEISRWLEISILLEVSRTHEANSQEERQ